MISVEFQGKPVLVWKTMKSIYSFVNYHFTKKATAHSACPEKAFKYNSNTSPQSNNIQIVQIEHRVGLCPSCILCHRNLHKVYGLKVVPHFDNLPNWDLNSETPRLLIC